MCCYRLGSQPVNSHSTVILKVKVRSTSDGLDLMLSVLLAAARDRHQLSPLFVSQ